VPKSVDGLVLGTNAFQHVGSSPTEGNKYFRFKTILFIILFYLLFFYKNYNIYIYTKAHNSVGRVIALQAIGHRFESGWA
jgi:hypothetical protein